MNKNLLPLTKVISIMDSEKKVRDLLDRNVKDLYIKDYSISHISNEYITIGFNHTDFIKEEADRFRIDLIDEITITSSSNLYAINFGTWREIQRMLKKIEKEEKTKRWKSAVEYLTLLVNEK